MPHAYFSIGVWSKNVRVREEKVFKQTFSFLPWFRGRVCCPGSTDATVCIVVFCYQPNPVWSTGNSLLGITIYTDDETDGLHLLEQEGANPVGEGRIQAMFSFLPGRQSSPTFLMKAVSAW